MGNMKSLNAGHNIKIFKQKSEKTAASEKKKEWNCLAGVTDCPLKGKLLTDFIIYKARISTNDGTSTYIGQASNTFKGRFLNHP